MHVSPIRASWTERQRTTLLAILLVLALLLKFLWPLVVYKIPLGYDVGIYRYLFIRQYRRRAKFPPSRCKIASTENCHPGFRHPQEGAADSA